MSVIITGGTATHVVGHHSRHADCVMVRCSVLGRVVRTLPVLSPATLPLAVEAATVAASVLDTTCECVPAEAGDEEDEEAGS